MQQGSSPPQHMELQSGRSFSSPARPADVGGSYATPGPAATPPGARAAPAGESPTSSGVRSSSEAEYSETARLVHSSALSDDGMTPLIQVGEQRGRPGRSWVSSASSAPTCPLSIPLPSRFTPAAVRIKASY